MSRAAVERGLILAVTLVLIGLLALTMAGFVFFVKAETAGIHARSDGEQARLAAESGLEELVSILRDSPHDATAWFDVPTRFRHALVWAQEFDRDSDPVAQMGSRQEYIDSGEALLPSWRYSLVARRFDGPPDTMRFGVTPESAKLNLNFATEEQLTKLFSPLLLDIGIENPSRLVDALLDWRDADDDVRTNGAESEQYRALTPAYDAKNGPFDTVDELLLVKGFSAAVLYGEDINRNGILDENEDDGETSEPFYDNGDGVLNPGIAPFLTVWAREVDTAIDNKPRINLNLDAGAINAAVAAVFDETDNQQEVVISQEAIDFLLGLKAQNFNFSQLRSVADLYVSDEERDAVAAVAAEPNLPAPQIPQELLASPVTLEDLGALMDRFSVRNPQQANAAIVGTFNINAAPSRVLELIPGITPEAVDAIVATRGSLERADLMTPAWPLTRAGVDPTTFKQIAPFLTTKAYQFHVEALGYGDHVQL